MKISPTILVDRREQRAWQFENLPSKLASLTTADYSIAGLQRLVAVERKSLPDLLGCVGHDRDRFKRELQRLRAYRFRCLIIETDYSALERGGWRSKVQPAAVLGSLAAWQCQYELAVMLVGTHEAGARFCERFLYQAAPCVATENTAVGVAAERVA